MAKRLKQELASDQLRADIAAMEKRYQAVFESERQEVIAKIKPALAKYGITAADLGLNATGSAKPTAAKKVARKQRVTAAPEAPAEAPTTNPPTKGKRRNNSLKGIPAPVRYRSGDNTWTGRGLKPKWLTAALQEDGVTLESFKV